MDSAAAVDTVVLAAGATAVGWAAGAASGVGDVTVVVLAAGGADADWAAGAGGPCAGRGAGGDPAVQGRRDTGGVITP